MTLTFEEHVFLIVVILNTIIAVLYLLIGSLIMVPIRNRKREGEAERLHDNRRTYLLRFIVMLLCPVVGPLFFFVVHFFYLTIFRFQVELDDVVFSKERVRTQLRADEEREMNVIPLEEAVALIAADELQHSISYAYSVEYEKDIVINQNIAEGQRVKKGRFIELTVSQGKQTFVMPQIEGMTLSEANVTLGNNRVQLQTTETVSDEVPAGRIISQEPKQGEEVATGSVISVVVSKGKEIVVPDLRGRTEDDAMVYLVLQGLTLGETTRQESFEYEEGFVIGQSLNPGDPILEGNSIDLVVSSGPGPQSKTARVSYTLPSGEDVTYTLSIEVTDTKGTREEYKNQHHGGETIVRDVTINGSGTVKVYLDGDVVYNQDIT